MTITKETIMDTENTSPTTPDNHVATTPARTFPPTDTPQEPPAPTIDPALAKARDEAASYRRRLRATETERDQLKAQIKALTDERDQLATKVHDHERARRVDMIVDAMRSRPISEGAVRDELSRMDDEAIAAMLLEGNDGQTPDVNNQKIKEWFEVLMTNKPWLRLQPKGDLALKTLLLAENPQGAFNPKPNTLRNALHR